MMHKILFFLIGIGLISACASSQQPHDFSAEQPALHALHDRELRDLMDRMSGLMLERFMTEHEMDIERRKYARQIIETADILQSSVKSLINRAPVLGMTSDEQHAFLAMAQKLGHHAETLKVQAERNRFNAIDETLHEMKSTCMACHTLFRKI